MDRAELMRQVRAGEYVVDPYAVADAMLHRAPVRDALLAPSGADGASAVLEPAEVDRLAARADEPHAD